MCQVTKTHYACGHSKTSYQDCEPVTEASLPLRIACPYYKQVTQHLPRTKCGASPDCIEGQELRNAWRQWQSLADRLRQQKEALEDWVSYLEQYRVGDSANGWTYAELTNKYMWACLHKEQLELQVLHAKHEYHLLMDNEDHQLHEDEPAAQDSYGQSLQRSASRDAMPPPPVPSLTANQRMALLTSPLPNLSPQGCPPGQQKRRYHTVIGQTPQPSYDIPKPATYANATKRSFSMASPSEGTTKRQRLTMPEDHDTPALPAHYFGRPQSIYGMAPEIQPTHSSPDMDQQAMSGFHTQQPSMSLDLQVESTPAMLTASDNFGLSEEVIDAIERAAQLSPVLPMPSADTSVIMPSDSTFGRDTTQSQQASTQGPIQGLYNPTPRRDSRVNLSSMEDAAASSDPVQEDEAAEVGFGYGFGEIE